MTETSPFQILLALLLEQYTEVEKIRTKVDSGETEKSALETAYNLFNPTVNALIRCDVRNGVTFSGDKKPEFINVKVKGGPSFRFPVKSLTEENKKKVDRKMNAQIASEMKELREWTFVPSDWGKRALRMIEVLSFKAHAVNEPKIFSVLVRGLTGSSWIFGAKGEIHDINAFWDDYSLPFTESVTKRQIWLVQGEKVESQLPTKEQLLFAFELGRIRYERAMALPLPEKWCTSQDRATDALLARFPQFLALENGDIFTSPAFWQEYPHNPRNFGPLSGTVTGSGWIRIGFGNPRTGPKEYVLKNPEHKILNPIIPTPSQLYDWVKEGKTVQSYFEAQATI